MSVPESFANFTSYGRHWKTLVISGLVIGLKVGNARHTVSSKGFSRASF